MRLANMVGVGPAFTDKVEGRSHFPAPAWKFHDSPSSATSFSQFESSITPYKQRNHLTCVVAVGRREVTVTFKFIGELTGYSYK
jgi:hypothetical protein